jgi:hypothetical protein
VAAAADLMPALACFCSVPGVPLSEVDLPSGQEACQRVRVHTAYHGLACACQSCTIPGATVRSKRMSTGYQASHAQRQPACCECCADTQSRQRIQLQSRNSCRGQKMRQSQHRQDQSPRVRLLAHVMTCDVQMDLSHHGLPFAHSPTGCACDWAAIADIVRCGQSGAEVQVLG